MKKIVVDMIPLLSKRTGVGRYLYENITRISKITNDNYSFVYWYGYYSSKIIGIESNSNPQNSLIGYTKKVLDKFTLLKRIARKATRVSAKIRGNEVYDLYWQPNFIPESHIKSKLTVTTVHDLSFHLHPQWHPKERIEYFSQNFFDNIGRSDHIITVSKYIKQEIIDTLNIEADKISVIYNGIDQEIYKEYSDDESKTTADKFNLPNKYILFVGSIEPRKNLINLLRAYTNLPESIKNEYPLLLVGYKGWGNDEIYSIIKKNKSHIYYVGYVNDLELAHIYSRASLFIYPSYYEGFGIPPIEAMACATPVIVSNKTSLPEVCGDCALYIEPDNPDDIREKILYILNDKSLQQNLREKGKKWVSRYSWDKSAKEHMILFERLLSQ